MQVSSLSHSLSCTKEQRSHCSSLPPLSLLCALRVAALADPLSVVVALSLSSVTAMSMTFDALPGAAMLCDDACAASPNARCDSDGCSDDGAQLQLLSRSDSQASTIPSNDSDVADSHSSIAEQSRRQQRPLPSLASSVSLCSTASGSVAVDSPIDAGSDDPMQEDDDPSSHADSPAPAAMLVAPVVPVMATLLSDRDDVCEKIAADVRKFPEERLRPLQQLYFSYAEMQSDACPMSWEEFAGAAVSLARVVPEAPARHITVRRKAILLEQAARLPLLPTSMECVVPPAVGVASDANLAAAGEDERVSAARRLDLAVFLNTSALLFRDCCCCYRPVRQVIDPIGGIKRDKRRAGETLDSPQSYARFKKLLPAVLKDLQRKYALRCYDLGMPQVSEEMELPMAERAALWICQRCCNKMSASKSTLAPAYSMQNQLLLADVPEVLSRLSQYERHLIARVRPFHELVYLPLGQKAARGLSISYPSDVLTLVESLPARTNDSDVVIVRQAPDNKSNTRVLPGETLPARAADDFVEAPLGRPAVYGDDSSPLVVRPPARRRKPLEYRVRTDYVRQALTWLLENNEVYKDITVSAALEEERGERKSRRIKMQQEKEQHARKRQAERENASTAPSAVDDAPCSLEDDDDKFINASDDDSDFLQR
jgi:hypothetical protein